MRDPHDALDQVRVCPPSWVIGGRRARIGDRRSAMGKQNGGLRTALPYLASSGGLGRALPYLLLQIAQWWSDPDRSESEPYQGVSFAMNTDLGARAMSGEEISAVVAAWRSGAISRDTMLERLKRGEVLPDGRSVAQERALIHRTIER